MTSFLIFRYFVWSILHWKEYFRQNLFCFSSQCTVRYQKHCLHFCELTLYDFKIFDYFARFRNQGTNSVTYMSVSQSVCLCKFSFNEDSCKYTRPISMKVLWFLMTCPPYAFQENAHDTYTWTIECIIVFSASIFPSLF